MLPPTLKIISRFTSRLGKRQHPAPAPAIPWNVLLLSLSQGAEVGAALRRTLKTTTRTPLSLLLSSYTIPVPSVAPHKLPVIFSSSLSLINISTPNQPNPKPSRVFPSGAGPGSWLSCRDGSQLPWIQLGPKAQTQPRLGR